MKKTIFLIASLTIALNVWPVKFVDKGISYSVLSAHEVGVCRGDSSYTKDVAIPSSVSYQSTDYAVKSICDSAFLNSTGLTSVTLPPSITTIGNYAFSGCSGLTGIQIPDSVVRIGENAFYQCVKIKDVQVNNRNANIGSAAFYRCSGLLYATIHAKIMEGATFSDCTSLKSVTLGRNLTSFGPEVFFNCSSLEQIEVDEANAFFTDVDGVLFSKEMKTIYAYPNARGTSYSIPKSVVTIASTAFQTCYWLQSIEIPSSVTVIGESVFFGDSSLTSISLPPNLKYLSSWTFRDCVKLSTITIPDSVKGMGRDVFNGCSNLKSVSLPASLTTIGLYAFSYCMSLKAVAFPSSLITIGDYAFMDCKSLDSISFPSSLSYIGASAFQGCSGLSSVTIPPLVTRIYSGTFVGCTNLTQLTIPKSITKISGYAFMGCYNLSTINACGATPPVIYSQTFSGVNTSVCTLNVPLGSKAAYKANTEWNKFSTIVEKELTSYARSVEQKETSLISGRGFIEFKLNQPSEVLILTLDGRVALKKRLETGNHHINLSRGIYLLRFNNSMEKVPVE